MSASAVSVPAGTGFGSPASQAAAASIVNPPAAPATSVATAPAPAPVQAQVPQVQAPAEIPAAVEPPAPDTSTPAGEVAEVWRERYRKLQAAKDREVAEANRRLQAMEAQLSQAPQAPTQQVAQDHAQNVQDSIDAKRFLELINSDNPQQGIDYLTRAMERRAQEIADRQADQRVQQHMENAQRRAAFVREFEVATQGFTEAEQQATVNVISEAHSRGQTISPREAAVIARFGSVENAIRFASLAIQQQPQAAASVAAPSAMPLGQLPPRQAPMVPGTGVTPVVAPQAPQAPAPVLEHRYRGLL